MEEYLHRGIKEIITEFPEIGPILDTFNIGCTNCAAGSCLLKDIVEVHNLSADEENRLMRAIAGVVHPDGKVVIPVSSRKPRTSGKASYSPSLQRLVDEHVVIKRFLTLLPAMVENMDVRTMEGRKLILDCVDFIRSYADKYHHAKEEDILFPFFDENMDIIASMRTDHQQARAHVQAIVKGVNNGDGESVRNHLEAYGGLLAGHIKREDEILYPWMDRNLSTKQVGAMFSLFTTADERFGDAPQHSMDFVRSLEKQFFNREVLS